MAHKAQHDDNDDNNNNNNNNNNDATTTITTTTTTTTATTTTTTSISIPESVIIYHIAPFLNDRITFNNLSCVNRYIHEELVVHSQIPPPWPHRMTLFSSTPDQGNFPSCISLALTNHLLACGTSHGTVQVWDSVKGSSRILKTSSSESSKEGRITAVAFSPNSQYLACAGNRNVYLWKNISSTISSNNDNNNDNNNDINNSTSSSSSSSSSSCICLGPWMDTFPGNDRLNILLRVVRQRTSILLSFSSNSQYLICSRRFHIADLSDEIYTAQIWNVVTNTNTNTNNTTNNECTLVKSYIGNPAYFRNMTHQGYPHDMFFGARFSPNHPHHFACIRAGPGKYRTEHVILLCHLKYELPENNKNNNNNNNDDNNNNNDLMMIPKRIKIKTPSQIATMEYVPNNNNYNNNNYNKKNHQKIVTCHFDGSIRIWDCTTRKKLHTLLPSTTGDILVRFSIAFLPPPNGTYFATTHSKKIKLCSILHPPPSEQQQEQQQEQEQEEQEISNNPKTKKKKKTSLWSSFSRNVLHRRSVQEEWFRHKEPVTMTVISPNGQTIASRDKTGEIRLGSTSELLLLP